MSAARPEHRSLPTRSLKKCPKTCPRYRSNFVNSSGKKYPWEGPGFQPCRYKPQTIRASTVEGLAIHDSNSAAPFFPIPPLTHALHSEYIPPFWGFWGNDAHNTAWGDSSLSARWTRHAGSDRTFPL